MLALLPRGGESLTPRQKAGAREERDFNFLFLIDAFALLRQFKSVYEWRSRYISRYVNLKFGFLPFVVASIVAMVFLRRICSSRPGDGEQRGQSLAALTACDWGLYCFQPQRMAACLTCRLDVVCPNRLGGMMQPAKAAHGAFLARRKLAASGSPRAPCAFPNLRCYPRCWLFSCLGLWSHPHISPKEHQKERCGHYSAAALLHYVSWCASEYSVVGRISCYVPYDSARTNVCQ